MNAKVELKRNIGKTSGKPYMALYVNGVLVSVKSEDIIKVFDLRRSEYEKMLTEGGENNN